ncbi:PTS sugar transporter subunit IIA domain-containing protein [Olsenella massiliensis]|uniref:PTS sugar transporter subunit IIA domain-containing protein n=1 Tax=Olsenella massiliensis TaxID=1622075 RepID=UPI00071C47F0|nr:hypothetical protein [Olsenella massiliensis]
MVGFVVTGHGSVSLGMLNALEIIAGPQDDVVAVPFHEKDAADFGGHLHEQIARMAAKTGHVVIFCDLVGGSPFNQAMLAAQDIDGVEVVAGMNLPMLLEATLERGASVGEVCDAAVEAGRTGVAHTRIPSADETADDLGEDGI